MTRRGHQFPRQKCKKTPGTQGEGSASPANVSQPSPAGTSSNSEPRRLSYPENQNWNRSPQILKWVAMMIFVHGPIFRGRVKRTSYLGTAFSLCRSQTGRSNSHNVRLARVSLLSTPASKAVSPWEPCLVDSVKPSPDQFLVGCLGVRQDHGGVSLAWDIRSRWTV
jgi:hypothetical protein